MTIRLAITLCVSVHGGYTLAREPAAEFIRWGPNDEFVRLSLMTETSQASVLNRIVTPQVYEFAFIAGALKLRADAAPPNRFPTSINPQLLSLTL